MFGRISYCVVGIFLALNTANASKLDSDIKLQEQVSKGLSLNEAQDLVAHIQTNFPLEVNERVLKWLNHYLYASEGRAYVLSALANMSEYEALIKERLSVHKLPNELMAVPFVKSGFRNGTKAVDGSVGIWQFIPYTAKKYGLKVDEKIDDRFDVSKLTNAAIRYFKELREFPSIGKDWRLALLAYHVGEKGLAREMKNRNTKDPWAFEDLGGEDYLAKVMAVAIILNNPRKIIFASPLESYVRSSKFGPRRNKRKGLHFHTGLDMAARVGSQIICPMDGKVLEVTPRYLGSPNFGNTIVIDHGNDVITRFYHLHNFQVKPGDYVTQGAPIGTVGNTGISTGPHLHFEVLIEGSQVNPEIFLSQNN